MVDPTSQLRIEYLLKRISRSRKGKQLIIDMDVAGNMDSFSFALRLFTKKDNKKAFWSTHVKADGQSIKEGSQGDIPSPDTFSTP